jgi:ribosomal protein S18 acetylase RimI-like enzyme
MRISEFDFIWETYKGNIEYKISEDEDSESIAVTAFINGEKIGEVGASLLFGDFYYQFEDDFTEEEIDNIFPEDTLAKIDYIEVYKEYRGYGIANKLMNNIMDKLINDGVKQFYLNASPMGMHKSLNKSDLVNFYKKYGFEILLDQGGNTLMIKKL